MQADDERGASGRGRQRQGAQSDCYRTERERTAKTMANASSCQTQRDKADRSMSGCIHLQNRFSGDTPVPQLTGHDKDVAPVALHADLRLQQSVRDQ